MARVKKSRVGAFQLVTVLGLMGFLMVSVGGGEVWANWGTVLGQSKISDTEGNFSGSLDDGANFGEPASLGDFDGDGVTDMVCSAYRQNDGGTARGAIWILLLNSDGTVKSHQKISDIAGGFTGAMDNYDWFGCAVVSLGDLDDDGITDIAVGATGDDDGGADRGAVWILFLNANGTVKGHQKISDTRGDFSGVLHNDYYFGSAVAALGDLDGDGVTDIAVGAQRDGDGGWRRGGVWILFLNSNGTVKSSQEISDTEGGFGGVLDDYDEFGHSVCNLGDLDGDGVTDIAVGARLDDDGGNDTGAVWILFLNSDGTVKGYQKISATQGGFLGDLDSGDRFSNNAALGDLDGDGVNDLAVSAFWDDDGGYNRGAVWILFLNTDGTVKSYQKISATEGNFTGSLNNSDQFGTGLAALDDLDGDGKTDLAVGALLDDDGGAEKGAVWILFLDGGSWSEPVAIEIVGPAEVAENSQSQYQAIAHYDDGRSRAVTDSVDWSVAPDAAGEINAAGLLQTYDLALPQEITIFAQYSEGGITVEGEKTVSVLFLCPSGYALQFDGRNDYVTIPDDNSLQLALTLTIEAWVKPIYDGRDYYADAILVKGENVGWGPHFNYRIAMENSGLYTWGVCRSGRELFYHGGTPQYDSWQHLALTADGLVSRAYLNGVEVASRAAPGPYLTFPGYPLQIGGHSLTNARWFSGLVDEVRIWNVVRTAGQIKTDMHIRLPGDQPGLAGYWNFDEGQGQVAHDLSGNGNDGQLGSSLDEDESDPIWVESDAPVGICTWYGMALQKIESAIARKSQAQEIIDGAMADEQAATDVLNALLEDGDLDDLSPADIVRARQKIHSAMQHERQSKQDIDKSVIKLESALAILDGQSNGNGGGNDLDELYQNELIETDLNGDGVIDARDFAVIMSHWLESYRGQR